VRSTKGPQASRHRLLVLLAAVTIGTLIVQPAVARATANPIQSENAHPGTTAWQLPAGVPSTNIEGYASQVSVRPGDLLQLHVSTTPAASYHVEIYRLGWYHGSGGRLIECVPVCAGSEPGASQPVPQPAPGTGYLDAGWPVTDTITIGSGWTTGYYLAKLVLASGPQSGGASYVPFIIRASAAARSTILVQAPVNTWEAYNNWGGKSLYTFNSTGGIAATQVSFDRPLAGPANAWPYEYEYNLVRFLERGGYDVSYQTNVDTDQTPGSLLTHKLDISSGHDEYWTKTMRDAWESARAAGVNLAFIGADIGTWQMRYADPTDRTLLEYRTAAADPNPDPAQKTVQFRALTTPRPECQLLGVGFDGGQVQPGDPQRAFSVAAGTTASSWFAGTTLAPGDSLADTIGFEWDDIESGCAVPPLHVLLHYSGKPSNGDAVTYQASSGARVFSDGSEQLVWDLDDFRHTPHQDSRVQRLFTNIFNNLGGQVPDPTVPDGLPAQELPAPGGASSSPVAFRWSTPPTGLTTYRLQIDGNLAATINAGTCTSGTCTTTIPLAPGAHSWLVQATDALGNSVTSTRGSFIVDNTPPAPFKLRSPMPRAVLWTPRPTLSWSTSSDTGVGLAPYEVLVDGKRIAATAKSYYTLARDLRDGTHTWAVIAADRAGNQRPARPRTFRVESVRLVHHSRGYSLTHRFTLLVYCARPCSAHVKLRLGRNGPTLSTLQRSARAGGVTTIKLALTRAFRLTLGRTRSAQMLVTVRTRSGESVRQVTFSADW
jgi:hypothetical protein